MSTPLSTVSALRGVSRLAVDATTGISHFDLLSRPEVYVKIREWLT